MALRISENGPEFPDDFLDSLLAGEVVFLCGTGVSAPQMPDFRRLVERTYEILAVERTDSEELACEQGGFEEVLGSLSRRLSDPHAVTNTVSCLLAVPDNPILDQHHTILRLSRDLDNRICVVTTNFETLFERSIQATKPGEIPRNSSFAGQALPAPGSAAFSGIIHIHGRLGDAALGLVATPLVLTSADYGDAYMRSGWVSRFLFDLARCKSIALVGYSAGDAPVRYFLNVLEADRARFPDLKTVYAFGAYENNPEEAVGAWGTLAVRLLPYCKVNANTGAHDHSPLWDDLAKLADIADRPKQSRQERARKILAQPAAKAGVNARKELGWLFGGRRDLWRVALAAISDPSWFEVFQDDSLWSAEDATWVIAAWVAKNFQDRDRLECACEWQRRLGRPFTENIERRLTQQAGDLEKAWQRAWRLFCHAIPVEGHDTAYRAAQKQLTSDVVLDSDLRHAVGLLAPRLELRSRRREFLDDSDTQPVVRLSDLLWARMVVSDRYSVEKLMETLLGMTNRAGRVLDLATAELQSALELEADLDMIGEDYDENDFRVRSIENHRQNHLRQGENFLVRVLAESLLQAATLDRDHARSVATGWKRLPGRIGLRLCLHAMRDADLFDANETMNTLLSVSGNDFWSIRREIPLLLKDRAGAASRTLVRRVEKRIRESGDAYYLHYAVQPGETDWRAHARDTAVWLRLNMLREAGALSKAGFAELAAIQKRRDYLDRAVDDDFFAAHVSEGRYISGDPAPIKEADEGDRLQVARELAHSHELDLRAGWSAFCRSDLQAAFDSLQGEDLTPENGSLWNTFLGELAFNDEASKAICDNLAINALKHLTGFSPDTLQPMVSGLVDLIYSRPLKRVGALQRWLDLLWRMVSEQHAGPLDLSPGLYEKAIKSPAGKLSHTLLLGINARQQRGFGPTRAQRELLGRMSKCEGAAGQLGGAMLVRNLAFLFTMDRQCVVEVLGPRIGAENAEGAALRDVMLRHGSITPELTQVFSQAITTGVIESRPVDYVDYDGSVIASRILLPALDEVRGNNAVQWGLTASDAAQVLRKASQAIRIGALTALADWLGDNQTEVGWHLTIVLFFERVWPKEREFRDASTTSCLIDLAVGAGDEFPKTLELLKPYIVPYDRGYGSLHSIAFSEAPEKFPRETLDLLWLVCGQSSRGSFYEISEIIDRLIAVEPDIEIDRRLQWLEHRAVRYD